MTDESKDPQPQPDAPKSATDGEPAAPTAEELAELRRKAADHDQLMDRLKRVTAEYLNSQKRLERRADERVAYAIESFARELLLVADDLWRAIKAAREHQPDGTVSAGLELVEKHLDMVLARHGILPIETKIGEPFDSNGHEAISVVQTDEMEPGRVVEELQRGFRLHGRVLRPARVSVSAAKG
ncbi:MAG: nucleotide exchange factor GrpE [Candidatus Brocadiia bacterium]|jgi:molecular chaperone GrpE